MGKSSSELLLSPVGESTIQVPKRVNFQDMSVETGLDLPLEIANLLLIDALGYSKLLVNEKIELLQELNYILHSFRVAEAIGYA